ncbi:MAG: helix-turn-helix transcriptional regulator [Lachnospiraceae bacterium]|nr:helix-turn-helix transcriptional regulator [Lachnospiraceae bacterium]
MSELQALGYRLKIARKKRGLSQEALAALIGTSRGVITNIELNKILEPQPLVINSICNVLKINKEWLLYNVGEMDCSEKDCKESHILEEIAFYSKDLSEEEQLYILDLIKTYQKHHKKPDKS